MVLSTMHSTEMGAMHMVPSSSVASFHVWEGSIEADVASVAVVRRHVHALMVGWGWEGGSLDDVVLICSELVTNAIVHTALRLGGDIRVRVQESAGDCRIEVLDSRPDLMPVTPIASPNGEGGRGCYWCALAPQTWTW